MATAQQRRAAEAALRRLAPLMSSSELETFVRELIRQLESGDHDSLRRLRDSLAAQPDLRAHSRKADALHQVLQQIRLDETESSGGS